MFWSFYSNPLWNTSESLTRQKKKSFLNDSKHYDTGACFPYIFSSESLTKSSHAVVEKEDIQTGQPHPLLIQWSRTHAIGNCPFQNSGEFPLLLGLWFVASPRDDYPAHNFETRRGALFSKKTREKEWSNKKLFCCLPVIRRGSEELMGKESRVGWNGLSSWSIHGY